MICGNSSFKIFIRLVAPRTWRVKEKGVDKCHISVKFHIKKQTFTDIY